MCVHAKVSLIYSGLPISDPGTLIYLSILRIPHKGWWITTEESPFITILAVSPHICSIRLILLQPFSFIYYVAYLLCHLGSSLWTFLIYLILPTGGLDPDYQILSISGHYLCLLIPVRFISWSTKLKIIGHWQFIQGSGRCAAWSEWMSRLFASCVTRRHPTCRTWAELSPCSRSRGDLVQPGRMTSRFQSPPDWCASLSGRKNTTTFNGHYLAQGQGSVPLVLILPARVRRVLRSKWTNLR